MLTCIPKGSPTVSVRVIAAKTNRPPENVIDDQFIGGQSMQILVGKDRRKRKKLNVRGGLVEQRP